MEVYEQLPHVKVPANQLKAYCEDPENKTNNVIQMAVTPMPAAPIKRAFLLILGLGAPVNTTASHFTQRLGTSFNKTLLAIQYLSNFKRKRTQRQVMLQTGPKESL